MAKVISTKVKKVKTKRLGTKANKKEYSKKRRAVLAKIRRYEKKYNVSIPRPSIPKFIDKGSIRKLERLSEKLSKTMKQGKLEKVYGEKKYEGPTGTPEAPSFEEIVLDDYMNFIMEAYDDDRAIDHYNSLPQNKYHLLHGGKNSLTLSIIRAHADHCMNMLHRITLYDEEQRKDVVWNLAHETAKIYKDTEVYIYGYVSIREYGTAGDPQLLHDIEEALTRAVENREMTPEEENDYYEIQSQFSDQGDIY